MEKKKIIIMAGLVATFLIIFAPWKAQDEMEKTEEAEKEESEWDGYNTYFQVSKALGFPLKEPKKVPFEAGGVRHKYCGKGQRKYGQTEYEELGGDRKLIFCQAKTDYRGQEERKLRYITVKGEKIAVWQDEKYTYALKATPGISEEEMKKIAESVADWEPRKEWGDWLKEDIEDVDLEKSMSKLFAGAAAKKKYGKATLQLTAEDCMLVSNRKNSLKWKQAVFLWEPGEEDLLCREDVLGLEDSKLEKEGFTHYVLEDGSRFGLEIRRNAKGYENCVIVNWMTGADFELTIPENCGAILDNTDGYWTDEKIVRMVLPDSNKSIEKYKKYSYPYDKYGSKEKRILSISMRFPMIKPENR